MKDLKKQFITTFLSGAVLLAGIVILLNMVFNNIDIGRFDLTADQIYKLSPSVKKILTELEAPIEITYYVSSSEKMPTQWKNLERDVIDKLKELKLASEGRLNYSVFDPSAEEEKEAYEEREASEETDKDILETKPQTTRKKIAESLYEKGVIPFGVQSAAQDEFAIKRVYSSIVLSYLDRKEEVIEEVRPESFGSLEYEIVSRIYKLISNRRPRIAFYPGQPDIPPQYRQYYQQAPPDFYEYAAQLLREEGYDVTRTNIKEDDPIPGDIQTMVMMVDQQLNERQLYEIDRLIHKGVRFIIAAQQYNYQITASRDPGKFDLRGAPSMLNINTLTGTYGLTFDEQMFMDRSSAFIQIPVYQTQRMGVFEVRQQRLEPVTKPVIIKVSQENINTNLSISNKISEIFYMFGGRLDINDELLKQNNLQKRVLFTSSANSWTRQGYGYGAVNELPPTENELMKYQPLGVLIEGRFPAKYTNQNIPEWPADPEEGEEQTALETEVLSEITGDALENKIIAFGCANMFKSDILQSVTSHKALLLNSVDAMTLGEELINIRSKNIAARRIRETSSFGKALSKAFVVWLTPAVFVVLGFYLTVRRRMK